MQAGVTNGTELSFCRDRNSHMAGHNIMHILAVTNMNENAGINHMDGNEFACECACERECACECACERECEHEYDYRGPHSHIDGNHPSLSGSSHAVITSPSLRLSDYVECHQQIVLKTSLSAVTCRAWAWTFWKAELPLPENTIKKLEEHAKYPGTHSCPLLHV